MSGSRGNSGAFVFVAVLVAGYLALRTIYGFDPMPVLRGIHLGIPLVCVLVGAIILVLWASKFFDSH